MPILFFTARINLNFWQIVENLSVERPAYALSFESGLLQKPFAYSRYTQKLCSMDLFSPFIKLLPKLFLDSPYVLSYIL